MVYKLSSFTLLPGICLLCQQASRRTMDLCECCEQALPFNHNACQCCGLPLAQPAASCGDCQQYEPPFHKTVSAFSYQSPINHLIKGFKYNNKRSNGRLMSTLMADAVREHYANEPLPELLLAVPLHWWRLFWRGFNQADEISQYLNRQLGIACNNTWLKRKQYTKPQNTLSRKQRIHNLKHAFTLSPKAKLPAHVAIVDDVMTTGATVICIAKLLKAQGVKRVDVWTLARTPSPKAR